MSSSITSLETLHSGADTSIGGIHKHSEFTSRIQQNPLSVTLDGPQIAATALALLVALHFLELHATMMLVALTPVILFVNNDYQNYLNLGPGGTPSTFMGYLKIAWLTLWQLHDPFKARPVDTSEYTAEGVLHHQHIPYRAGLKPTVVGIAPQRQIDQPGSPYCYQALRRTLEKLCAKNPEKFCTARSCVEKHGLGFFARDAVRTTCQGEICHVHDSDYAMHLCLHPDDSRVVLEKGWGRRHPLGWKWRFIRTPVSPNFVMIYAPRGMFCSSPVYRVKTNAHGNI